ncbi:MAG: polyprenyl synthetase family protein [Calditrichaeota bacterium]|nr:polyprenyl synthetase family protein [Calditrichota bacterium]HQU72296.1 polyprenyl synthetase family protein [Calditrichia bacterium]
MVLPEIFTSHIETVEQGLHEIVTPEMPALLRDPILYFLQMPGKKIRPLLCMAAAEAVRGESKAALPAALAVELFHDFTLIHDDIMDQDELRRGLKALHVRYDDGTAILVGDLMIGLAYQQLMQIPQPALDSIARVFSEALVRVCEGQALDKEFENRSDVTLDEYLEMIGKKTGWLIKVACELGALCGGGSEREVQELARFGYSLGLAFQIQDDLLDVIADQEKLGKKVGSDFLMDKKTYVTLKYMEMMREQPELMGRYPAAPSGFDSFQKFQEALRELGIVDSVQETVDYYTEQTLDALSRVMPLTEENPLYALARYLQKRQS